MTIAETKGKLVMGHAIFTCVTDYAFGYLESLDILRDPRDCQDPETIMDMAAKVVNKLFDDEWTTENNTVVQMQRTWYEARGFLDSNDDRTVSSPCNLSAYCWLNAVIATMISVEQAMNEIVMAIYPRRDRAANPYGDVATRSPNWKKRPRGRPPKGKQKPIRVVGRPVDPFSKRQQEKVLRDAMGRPSDRQRAAWRKASKKYRKKRRGPGFGGNPQIGS